MVTLADILRRASKKLYAANAESINQISLSAMVLDRELQEWKDNLPPALSLDNNSLQNPKWLNKQKVVLRLSTAPKTFHFEEVCTDSDRISKCAYCSPPPISCHTSSPELGTISKPCGTLPKCFSGNHRSPLQYLSSTILFSYLVCVKYFEHAHRFTI